MMNSQDRISSVIEASRKELLDLGLRNPLLNYRPSRARGLGIVDELPTEVFRILVRERKSMSFKPAPEGYDSEAEGEGLLAQPGDEGENGDCTTRTSPSYCRWPRRPPTSAIPCISSTIFCHRSRAL